MAKKLYVFGIGGTGSRVIKSLAMLLAAGVQLDNDFDTVIPIIIDPDTENGDLNRTKDILRLYQEVRNQIKDPVDFFKQQIKTVNELSDPKNKTISPDYFQFKLNDVDSKTFGQYIGFDSLSDERYSSKDDKSFVKLLYSNGNLNSDLSIGFKGNPNMGSIVLNQFTTSEDFKRFGQTFGPEDAIFIINSIFGGTGAAGFPLLLKNLRGNTNLLNFAQIKDAPIGGLTCLPYYTLDKRGEINAESFEEKAKIAIDYYNRTIINQRKINVLHFIGNRGNTNAEGYAVGGQGQRNKAHFLEIAGALSIVEFCKNISKYSCANGQTIQPTEIKEFGVERSNENISFNDLNIDNKEQIYKPLSKFRLFTQYLFEGLDNAKNVSRWTKSDIKFVAKQKQSPCNSDYFDSSEYKNQVVAFNNHFKDWIDELSKNKPAFIPFFDVIPNHLYSKIDTQNCLNVDNLKLRSEIDKKSGKPKQFHTTLIKLFGISTSKVYHKLPFRVSDDEKKVIKVYRLHEKGQEGTGWFISAAIDKDALKTIKTEGKDIASSIPSPFARIDLVKSAFDWLNYEVSRIVGADQQEAELSSEDKLKIREIIEGRTAQNKLISYALDIAQLFFKYPDIKDKIEIFAWKPSDRFEDLIENSSDQRHKIFAHTLKIYWDQDSIKTADQGIVPALYNFEHVDRLFFVINKNTKQIIGGTSPSTLFFAAPDSREAFRGLDIKCGQDKLLDDIYLPLHKREVSFIEYLYAVAKQTNRFSTYFPELNKYLENVKKYLLDDSMHTVVANLTNNSINDYERCSVTNDNKDFCEILNLRIGIEKSFLEDKIIELPYTIDTAKFKTCGAKKHLLPLTPAFIKQFGTQNIEQYCRLEERAGGGIEAILTIPVQTVPNGSIQYKKLYHQANIIKLDIHLAIMPFLKPVKTKLDYVLGVIDDRHDKTENVSVKCYAKGNEIPLSGTPIVRNPGIKDVKSFYYKSSASFDAVAFGLNSARNFIIPNLKPCNENNKITFAVDFGTTNTHVEYLLEGNTAVPLDNSEMLPMFQSLLNKKDSSIDRLISEREETFEKEILPFSFSNSNSEIKFPLRTALVYNKQTNFKNLVEVFRQTNNYMLFEKQSVPNYFELRTDKLKWSNYSEIEDEYKVISYIEFLMYLVLYKILLLDGDPQRAKIIWFYPVSMEGSENSDGELGILVKIWKTVYSRVFDIENYDNLIQIPESIAPYLFYKSSVAGLSLSIDIGGGSSDIAVFDEHNENAILISSFKFAGNAIFGDGYPSEEFKNDSDKNGFVQCFKNDALKAVEEDSHRESILTNIIDVRKDSADFSSFLFSLEKDKSKQFSYTRLIEKNKKLKLSIMVFYGAIAYYSANLLKKSKVDIPKYILLSGTAAKTASILDSSAGNLKNLSGMFKHIFEKVYGKTVERDINLEVSQIPKEITCKGALKSRVTGSITTNAIKFWLGGFQNDKWSCALDKEIDIKNTPKYKDIDTSVKKSIKDAILDFYEILDDYTQNVRFESKYLIDQSAYERFKAIRENDIDDYLVRGLKAFYKTDDKHIEETLFFYPLIGILNKLTFELSKSE